MGEDKNTKDKEETMNKKNKNRDDEDEIKNQSMENLSKYLATLVGNFGNKIISKSGVIDWALAKKFTKGLQADLGSRFDEAGKLARDDINIVVEKFDDLRKFVEADGVRDHMKAARVAAAKLVKSL